MSSPFDQSTYQVRFDWGREGVSRLAPADLTVVVDVLRFSTTVVDALAAGKEIALADARTWSGNGADVAAAAPSETLVVLGSLRNAGTVARFLRDIQETRGARQSIAVIAAGERAGDGSLRVAVEDQLGAGAIIAALTDLGIDHVSPEAVVASESFRALRGALRHLVGAGGSGRELAQEDPVAAERARQQLPEGTVHGAAELDAVEIVPVLRDGVFRRG